MSKPLLIAVIDDDESVRVSLEDLAISLGYAVQTFASAEDFLAAKIAAKCACIVSDIRLPGINGFDLLNKLKDDGVTTPAILMTSFADATTRARASRTSACFLSKPFDAKGLVDCLKVALAKHPDTRV